MSKSEISSYDRPDSREERKRKKILFYTTADYGQANVIIAVAYELLLLQQYDIHIASFEILRGRIEKLNDSVSENHVPITFHGISGPAALDEMIARNGFIGPFPPGVRGAVNTYRYTLPAMATAWTEQEYMRGYQRCLDITLSLDPDIIVVDPLMSHGLEACNTLLRTCVVLSPNTFQELLRKVQPIKSQFLTIPAPVSGFAYPVPWYKVPANIFLKIILIFILMCSSKVRTLIRYRKANGLPSLPPIFTIWKEDNHYLLPSIPETDYPCYVPSNVTPCGPILLPTSPVLNQDPGLYKWLAQGPTILINLGSHIRLDDAVAREVSAGLKVLLDKKPDIQVLWKLKTSGSVIISSRSKSGHEISKTGLDNESLKAIASEILSGRIRIVEWLSVDPLAILETGHVVCAVHHGGSNSFHEALSAGVPQVVLPCWLDTLDFANKVEWLGIGVYGSRKAAPGVEATELSRALLRILDDGEEASRMSVKAKELAVIAGRVGGRKKASEKIIELLEPY